MTKVTPNVTEYRTSWLDFDWSTPRGVFNTHYLNVCTGPTRNSAFLHLHERNHHPFLTECIRRSIHNSQGGVKNKKGGEEKRPRSPKDNFSLLKSSTDVGRSSFSNQK